MKKIFSCSTSQFPVDKWNRYDQKLFEAVEKGDAKRVASVLSKRPIRATKNGPSGQSAFHLAAAKGLTECVTTILGHKVEINAKTDDGCTALHLAASNCNPECVKLLLQNGAHEDSIDFHSRTPLHCAATSGCVASVLLLCNAEDTVLDAADDDGQTPLMIAAQRNHPTVCSLLLDRGAQPDLRDRDKRTALILACEKGNIQSAETLLTKGADPELKDHNGCDALSYASLTRDQALQNLIRSALDRRKLAQSPRSPEHPAASKVVSTRDQELANIWKKRYEEEQKRGVWLQGELMIKTQHIERFSEERRVEKSRIQELLDHLEGQPDDPHSKPVMDTRSLLNRVFEHVRTLKDQENERRFLDESIQTLASENETTEGRLQEEVRRLEGEATSAREREEGARKRMTELEGHLENMREALSQFEKRKRLQSTVVEDLQEQITEVTREKEELLALLDKLKRREENQDDLQIRRLALTEKNALHELLKKLKSNCVNVEVRQNYDTSVRRSGYVPREVLERSADDWKANIASVENYIAAVETSQQDRTSLRRTDFEAVNGISSEQDNGRRSTRNSCLEETTFVRGEVPRLQEDFKSDAKKSMNQLNNYDVPRSDHARSRDSLHPTITALQAELASLRNTNADLLSRMNQVIQEKQNLEEGLLALQESMQSEFATRQETELRCKDYKHTIGVLSDELLAEQDKLKKLNGRLEVQKKEMEVLRDSFPPDVLREDNDRTAERFSSDVLEELYWNVGTLVKKYNEASQQAASLQKENQKLLDEQVQRISMTEHKNILNGMKNDLHAKIKEIEDLKQRLFQATASIVELKERLAVLSSNSISREEVEKGMADLERVVMALKEENEACKAALEGKCEEVIILKQQLEQEAEEDQASRREEASRLREFGQIRDNLESQLKALREEVQILTRNCSQSTEEAHRCKDLLASEQEKATVLQKRMKELEEEAEEGQASRREADSRLQELGQIRNNLESELNALREEVRVLTRNCELTTEEANRCKDLVVAEQENVASLQRRIKELEEEVENITMKIQKYEKENSEMNEKYHQLFRTSQEKEEKMEESTKELKSLTKEIEQLQRRCGDLNSQLEETNKQHQETVATYRTHLLNAAQGYMDEDVHLTLHWILKMQNEAVY